MTALIKLDAGLVVVGELSGSGWQLPANITQQQWMDAGAALAKIDQSKQWWTGDWWNACKWGDGRDACETVGVAYEVARNCGSIASAFQLSRRRDNLSFTHHAEVCAIPDEQTRDRLLDWCVNGENGKPRPTRELRDAVRQHLDEQSWTDEERKRRQLLKSGASIVLNQKTDERLVRWAQFEGRLVRIDRTTEWGNPFELPSDGTRDEVCDHYAIYLTMKPSLLRKIDTLRGKALACWCYPERCHGDDLAKLVNR